MCSSVGPRRPAVAQFMAFAAATAAKVPVPG
jgi:hypothetical protein